MNIKNPHSILAVLRHRPKDVEKICMPAGKANEVWNEIHEISRKLHISTERASGSGTSGISPVKDGRGGFSGAIIKERVPLDLEILLEKVMNSKGTRHKILLALDCLQDPHNVGAIFRTASFFGIDGIIITEERSAPLSSTVYDVASGGIESVPFSNVTNLNLAFRTAKERDFWILGTSENSSESFLNMPKDRHWVIVIGNEESGMRRLVAENCDMQCSIQGKGEVKSLNASVAAALLISNFSTAR